MNNHLTTGEAAALDDEAVKGRQLSTQDVAARLGVKPATVSGYRHHGYMPEPDGKLGKTVWWWEATIDAWRKTRPGQGWRKGVRGTGTPAVIDPTIRALDADA